jgi:signal transduction histidine kinase/ABC-type uncharacterized transport system substrate-binding protein
VRTGGKGWLRGTLATCLVAGMPGFALSAPPGSSPSTAPSSVVLMRGWDALYPMNLVREKALREAMTAGAARGVEFYSEEIDPLRFPEAVEADLEALLQRKYANLHVDLVVASGIESLEFAAAHRDAIWPGAAIVFNGVFEGATLPRAARMTGVTVPLDVDGTLALAQSLVPGLRHLFVVSGNSGFDRSLLAAVRAKLARADPALDVHYLAGLARAEASAQVATLEPDAAVLYLTMLRDAEGRIAGPAAPAMQQIVSNASVPVVSLIQTQFGRGPAGGSAPRFDLHGRAAGQVARRVLDGADPDSIAVLAFPPPTCEVDWNALARWRIPEGRIPPGCVTVNRPADPLRTYAWMVVAVALVVVVQAMLLSALLMQSRRRRIAEQKLLAHNTEMAQESRIAVLGALTANLAHEINQPMGAILSNTEAAQLMLEQDTLTPEKLREILADIRADDLRASDVIRELRALFGRGQWRPVAVELNAEVAEALRHVAFEAARAEVTIAPAYGAEMPAVMGDPMQLQQVVVNLVVNAIEAVAPLRNFRRVVRVLTSARRDGVEISVIDEGPGLAPEASRAIFESTFTTKRGSMGLGLSIVRSIVEMHHGKVWFEPNVPRGAVFRVWLPAIGA